MSQQTTLPPPATPPPLAPKTPRPPRSVRPGHVDVWCTADEANLHRGKIVGLLIEEDGYVNLRSVTEPRAVVIDGTGRAVRKINLSPNSSALYCYDLTITNEEHSSHAVTVESQPEVTSPWPRPQGEVLPFAFMYFENCLFGGKRFYNQRVDYVPGYEHVGLWLDEEGCGRVAAKWWLQPKAPNAMVFVGCTFWSSQEHAVYGHWSYSMQFYSCVFYPCGGADIQDVFRTGRPGTGDYYGNPMITMPDDGDFIVSRSRFFGEKLWGRQASTITHARGRGRNGRVIIDGVVIEGAIGDIAIWTDEYKGTWATDEDGLKAVLIGEVDDIDGYDNEDVIVEPHGELARVHSVDEISDLMPVNDIVLRNIRSSGGDDDRVAIQVTGYRRLWAENIEVQSDKPKFAVRAEDGGAWRDISGTVYLGPNTPEPLAWAEDYEPSSRYISAREVEGVVVPVAGISRRV